MLLASPCPGKMTRSAAVMSSGWSVTTGVRPNRLTAFSTEPMLPALYFIMAMFIVVMCLPMYGLSLCVGDFYLFECKGSFF